MPARPDHGRAALRFALDLHAAAAAVGGPLGRAQLRVGLHTGAVAAGVAGHVRPRFGIFGDVANVARRMQASARPGCVQLSAAARAQTGLPASVPFAPRAGLEIRGKGTMTAWVLEAGSIEAAQARAAADEPAAPPPPPPPQQPPSPLPRSPLQRSASAASLHPPGAPHTPSSPRSRRASSLSRGGGADVAAAIGMAPDCDDVGDDGAVTPRSAAGGVGGLALLADDEAGGADDSGSLSASVSRRGSIDAAGLARMAAASERTRAQASKSEAERLLTEKALSHFGTTVLFSSVPIAAYCAVSLFVGRAAWRERGGDAGDAAAAILAPMAAVVVPFYVAGAVAFVSGVGRHNASVAASRRWLRLLVAMQYSALALVSALVFLEYLTRRVDNCPAARHAAGAGGADGDAPPVRLGDSPAACARTYFWGIHLPVVSATWLTAQMPHSAVFVPELCRNAAYTLAALAVAFHSGGLTLSYALTVCAEGAFGAVVVPIVLVLSSDPGEAITALVGRLPLCPSRGPLAAGRRASDAFAHAIRARYFANAPLLDAYALAVVCAFACVITVRLGSADAPPLSHAASEVASLVVILLIGAVATKARPTDARALAALADRLGADGASKVLASLRARLASAPSEAAILAAGADALRALYPGAVASALAAFAEGSSCECVALLHVDAPEEGSRAALASALPAAVGAAHAASPFSFSDDAPAAHTSVALLCHGGGSAGALRDSRDVAGGVGAHADWAAAAAAGLPTAQAVTSLLTAGPLVVGFAQLHFGLYSRAPTLAPLRELCDTLGGALFVRRAFAVNRDAFGAAAGGGAAPRRRAGWPSGAASATGVAASETSSSDAGGAGAVFPLPPLSDEDAAAFAALDAALVEDLPLLRNWSGLDPDALDEGALRRLLSSMLHAHGLLRRFRIAPSALAGFVADVASRMHSNAFHHFRHAVLVTLTAWRLLDAAPAVADALTELGVLSLLLAAICHDLEHPGTTNAFQVNTGSALAMRYNDASVLENHHAATGFALLERAGILRHLSPGEYRTARKAILAAILATDMSAHKELLARVTAKVDAAEAAAQAAAQAAADAAAAAAAASDAAGSDGGAVVAPPVASLRRSTVGSAAIAAALSTPSATCPALSAAGSASASASASALVGFSDDSVEDRQLLICFILHCADLCNPLLPPALSVRIANALGREFDAQADAERAAGLPVTVMLAADAGSKAKMEVRPDLTDRAALRLHHACTF
jgi:hypothetical protein